MTRRSTLKNQIDAVELMAKGAVLSAAQKSYIRPHLKDALATLQWLQKHEETIKAKLSGRYTVGRGY